MNYAICECEKVSETLETIASWMKEEDKDISPENRKKLNNLSDKIIECSHEFNQIVEDHYKDEDDES